MYYEIGCYFTLICTVHQTLLPVSCYVGWDGSKSGTRVGYKESTKNVCCNW
jgi:hypothetical protein